MEQTQFAQLDSPVVPFPVRESKILVLPARPQVCRVYELNEAARLRAGRKRRPQVDPSFDPDNLTAA